METCQSTPSMTVGVRPARPRAQMRPKDVLQEEREDETRDEEEDDHEPLR